MSDLHDTNRPQRPDQVIPHQGTAITLPGWAVYAPAGSVPPEMVLPVSTPWS